MDSLRDTEDARFRFRDVPTISQTGKKAHNGSNGVALTTVNRRRSFAQSAQVRVSLAPLRRLGEYY